MALPPPDCLPDPGRRLAELDRRHAQLRDEMATIRPITRWTFVRGGLLMLIPLAYGAALAKLFT